MLCHCHGQGLYDTREICEQYVQCRKLENARQPLGGSFEKRNHIEKCGSTCFLSFLQGKLQLAPPSRAAPCDKVCSGKSGKRNWWLLPPSNPTRVPSLHALLARPHWVTKATFCGCHTAAQENTSSLFTVSPGLTHEQRSVTTPLLPVSLPCSKIDQIKSQSVLLSCSEIVGIVFVTIEQNSWSFQLVLTASKGF